MAPVDRLPPPPRGLSTRARKLWRDVVEGYELSPAEAGVLEMACRCWDRAADAAVAIERDGLVVLDRYGTPKSHPAADVELRARATFARLIAQLGVKLDSSSSSRRYGAKPGPRAKPATVRRA